MNTESIGRTRRRRSTVGSWVTRSVVAALLLATACGPDSGDIARSIGRLFAPERAGVAFGDHRFVSVGKFGIARSDDGTAFELLPNTGVLSWAAAYGSAGWVVADINALYTSDDASTWADAPLPIAQVNGVAFGAGRYVLVADGGATAVSEDGRDWAVVASATEDDLLAVAFVDGRFLAVGRNGAAVSSADGLAWSPVELAASVTLRGIASGDGATIVTGENGTILRSLDGGPWAAVEAPTDAFLTAATFAEGRFVAVGTSGRVLVSLDGATTFLRGSVTFGENPLGLSNDLLGVTYGDGTFVAVGQVLLNSSDGFSWVEVGRAPPDESGEPGIDEGL